MAGQAQDYHHGDQDIHAQQATFRAVMTATKWSCLAVAVGVLLFYDVVLHRRGVSYRAHLCHRPDGGGHFRAAQSIPFPLIGRGEDL